jgi:hypothetical protein
VAAENITAERMLRKDILIFIQDNPIECFHLGKLLPFENIYANCKICAFFHASLQYNMPVWTVKQ